jgi:protein disulfide-isomerase A6
MYTCNELFSHHAVKGEGVWIVEVYAPWCGHCKSLAPAWKQAAKALKGKVNIAALDGTENQQTAQKLGVKGFPTIKVYSTNKNKPTDYNGPREAKAIIDFALRELKKYESKSSDKKPSAKSEAKKEAYNHENDFNPGGGEYVVKLTTDNFKELVLDSENPWMVEFYAPWCGHCKNLAPAWAQAAEKLKDTGVKYGAVDATVETELATEYNIKGYPAIYSFPGGKKTKRSGKMFQGQRETFDLIEVGMELADAWGGSPNAVKIPQLVDAGQWMSSCNSKRICIVAILPNLYTENAEKRNARIQTIADAVKKGGRSSFLSFFWIAEGTQPKIEKLLLGEFGMTPALFAVSSDKRVYNKMLNAFDSDMIGKWFKSITTSNSGATVYPDSFTFHENIDKIAEWDGRDAQVVVEEEFSLTDLEF